MSEITIEKIRESSEFYTTVKRIKINGKSAVTPSRIISNSKNSFSESLYIQDKDIKKISESYKGIKTSTLHAMRNSTYAEDKFKRDLISPIEQSRSYNNINYFLIKYDTRTEKEIKDKQYRSSLPADSEIEYLLDIMDHGYNNFIITPIAPYLTGKQYINFLDKFIETNESFRDRPVGGLISSKLTRDEQSEIIDYFINKNLKIFIFDCYGNSPDRNYSSINLMMRKINKYSKNSKENVFTIASNVIYGRPHRTTPIAQARDILSNYYGFDSFAKSHIARGHKPPKPKPIVHRIFNRENYGYEITDLNDIDLIPKNMKFPFFSDSDLELLTDKKKGEIMNIINSYNLGIECNEILNKVVQEEKLSKYLSSKDQIPKKTIEDLLMMIRQTSVDEFFF